MTPEASSPRPLHDGTLEVDDQRPLLDEVDDEVIGAKAIAALRAGERAARDVSLEGATLAGLDLSDLDLYGCDLKMADLTGADLSGARLFGADLRRARLVGAKLDGADCTCADFAGARLDEASFEGAGLGRAILRNAAAPCASFARASLVDADLEDASLSAADFTGARLVGANLDGVDLERATLDGADLTNASIQATHLDRASMRGTEVRSLRGYRTASFLQTDVRDIDFSSNHLLREFISDQNYLDEFRRQGRAYEVLYRVWWLTSDCGRSVARWSACAAILAVLFSIVFTQVDIDYGENRTWLSPIYFSFVTFTTLGFGDVVPRSAVAQLAVMAEVVCGYVMLGGLLSLVTNKLARRAG